ncbi:hypothetical protein [Micromonospora sp. L31]
MPTPPRFPADLIDALCAHIAELLGEAPLATRTVCRPAPTSRRRRRT